MSIPVAPLRLGSRVCFEDRWQGRVAGLDVSDDWEVLNVTVASGFLFAARSVKLPASALKSWSDDAVYVAANSGPAFAREIPPVAAPSHPLDQATGTSHPGARFAGLTVRTVDRRASDVLLRIGLGSMFRVHTSDVKFEGGRLTLGVQPESLLEYHPDAEIRERVRRIISEDPALTGDDKLGLIVTAENGHVSISGNVRIRQTHDRVAALAAATPGVTGVRDEARDDFELETQLGLALQQSGLLRSARVAARSSLGVVTLYGTAPSAAVAEDVARAIARVPGVREVRSRLTVGAAA